ncbi:MAG TPA: DUF3052 family protein [Chloroflexota bacterium]
MALLNVPAGFEHQLALPDGAAPDAAAESDVILLFATSRTDLATQLGAAVAALAPAGGLWLAWPKKASGVPTDLTESAVRELGLATGLVDNKVCAIDETWSGLRFVRRLRDR